VSSRQLDSFSDGGIRQSTLVAVFSGIQGRFPLRAHAVEPSSGNGEGCSTRGLASLIGVGVDATRDLRES
jgi:hypothetical protein